jgi:hypothetical protein
MQPNRNRYQVMKAVAAVPIMLVCFSRNEAAAKGHPELAEILSAIVTNVERSQAIGTEVLYSVTWSQDPAVQRALGLKLNRPAPSREDEVSSSGSKVFVKRRSIGERNFTRVVVFEMNNGKAQMIQNTSGGHQNGKDRLIQFRGDVTAVIGGQEVIMENTRNSSPGTYPGLIPPNIPWPMVEEHLRLSRPKHEFIDPDQIRHGFIDQDYASRLLAGPGAISFDETGRYCILKYTFGSGDDPTRYAAKLDSEQSFLPVSVHVTPANGLTAAETIITYRRLSVPEQPDVFVPESLCMTNYLTADGQRSRMVEEELSLKSCELVQDDGISPLDAPLEQFPRFSARDLELLGALR